MAKSIADLFVNVGADISDFKKQMSDMQKTMKDTGKKLKDVGGTLSKYVTAPIMAVGGAALLAADEFDKAQKTIRAGTGATGEALDELTENFKNVFATVPQDAATVSSALADLNTRTGLTGKPLEELTKKFLELSKITGDDVGASIANVTRLFGDWGIQAEDSAGTMDYLWNVSQTTGIGVDQLSQKLVQFGAPMRGFGFTIEETAALMGKWEKEGVNMELIMGSLKQGLGKFAREGVDAREGLLGIIDAMKNAKTDTEAVSMAMEVFGARAGTDMAMAVREGRFEIDELLAVLNSSEETIGKAAADTMTLGDEFKMLKNNTMVALEPIGEILLELAKEYLPPLIETVRELGEWFKNLSPEMQQTIMIVAAIVAGIGPLLVVAGTLISSLTALAPLFVAVKAAIAAATVPIWPIIAAVAALIAIGVLLYKNWDTVKEWAGIAWNAIKDVTTKGVDWTKEKFNSMLDFIKNLGSSFKDAGKGLIDQLVNGIKNAADKAVNAVKDVVGKVRNLLPFSPAKEGPLSDLDKLDFGGPIGDSISRAMPKVKGMMGQLMTLPDMQVNQSKHMTTGSNVFIVELDGRVLVRGTLPHMEREIRLKTGVQY